MLAQEKLLNEHERKLLLLEQHLGLSLSQKTTSPTIPSNPVGVSTTWHYPTTEQTISTTRYLNILGMAYAIHYLKIQYISWKDDEEPRPTKRLQ